MIYDLINALLGILVVFVCALVVVLAVPFEVLERGLGRVGDRLDRRRRRPRDVDVRCVHAGGRTHRAPWRPSTGWELCRRGQSFRLSIAWTPPDEQ